MPDITTLANDGEFLTRSGTTIDGKTAAEARTALSVYSAAQVDTAIGNAASALLAEASTTTGQSNIGTVVDITDLSITFTVTADRPVLVRLYVTEIGVSAAGIGARVRITDAANVTQQSSTTPTAQGTSAIMVAVVDELITTPGTYTRKGRIEKYGAAGTVARNFFGATEARARISAVGFPVP